MTKNKKVNKVYRTLFDMRIRSGRQIITKFAKKYKLIYFGKVDQHVDDHKVIRGFTVSSTHRDNHYSVGSVDGYDVAFVNRNDAIWHNDKQKTKMCDWLILSIDLQAKRNIPHFLICPNNHDLKLFNIFFSTFPNIHDLNYSISSVSDSDFLSRFRIFAKPDNIQDIKTIFVHDTTKTIGAHFWPLSIEQHNNILYIYSVKTKVSLLLLETMLKNGLWLAKKIDSITDN